MNRESRISGVDRAADEPVEDGVGVPAPPDADSIAPILRILRKGRRFLVCSHARFDGDAVGSTLALGLLLRQMGKRVDLVSADRIPALYRRLPGADSIRTALRVHGLYDAAILLECDGLERTGLRGLDRYLLVNIDHHISGKPFAQVNWIDCKAVSTGEMIFRLVRAAGAKLTPEMADCLYTTVLTDTGGFCYGSVRESTFALARDLVRAGADPIAIAQQMYFSVPASKLLLLGAALQRLTREGRLAWLWVTQQDMVRTCAAEEDCEGIVNIALSIAGVEAAFFLRELPEGRVRVSLRSKGELNVAAIAVRLGGGGHENAAGFTIDGPLRRAVHEILGELRAALAGFTAASA
jgi:bifunctional oligoribonuclease and PAP phosphatase NrnA